MCLRHGYWLLVNEDENENENENDDSKHYTIKTTQFNLTQTAQNSQNLQVAAPLQAVGHWPLAVGSSEDDNGAAELQANSQKPKANSQAPTAKDNS